MDRLKLVNSTLAMEMSICEPGGKGVGLNENSATCTREQHVVDKGFNDKGLAQKGAYSPLINS